MILKQGNLRGERCKYPDGTVGLCVWYPIANDPDAEDSGMCFDLADKDASDMVALVSQLINTEPTVIEEDKLTPEPKVNRGMELVRRVIHPLGWWLLGR